MLAFTVQFSRYGRKPGSLGASAPRESRPVRGISPKRSGCFLRTQQRARQLSSSSAPRSADPRGDERTDRVTASRATE